MAPSTLKKTVALKNFAVLLDLVSDGIMKLNFFCRVIRSQYLNTEEFIDAVAEELRVRLLSKAKL